MIRLPMCLLSFSQGPETHGHLLGVLRCFEPHTRAPGRCFEPHTVAESGLPSATFAAILGWCDSLEDLGREIHWYFTGVYIEISIMSYVYIYIYSNNNDDDDNDNENNIFIIYVITYVCVYVTSHH